MKERILKFIKDNKLTFEEGNRNAAAVVIAGFVCYLNEVEASKAEAEDQDIDYEDQDIEFIDGDMLADIITSIPEVDSTTELYEEIVRVFNYAEANTYGNWWTNKKAHIQYIFE